MSIVPTGNPAWVRSNGHTAYGGNVNKLNYQSLGTVNPRTDLSAENLCRIAADLAAVARVSPFAVMTFTCNDTAGVGPPTINAYYAMAGSSPTPTRNGNGDATFQWAGSYADDYGVVANANIIAATATVVTNGANTYVATVELLDANADGVFESVRVRVVNQAVAAVLDAKVCLTIWTG